MQLPGRLFPGQIVRITVDFTGIDDVAGDPATVTFKTMNPCRVMASYVYGTDVQVTKPATGRYVLAIPSTALTEPGRWMWRVETTGATYAYEEAFVLQDSAFFNSACWGDYCQ
jgi:hypothetical protein